MRRHRPVGVIDEAVRFLRIEPAMLLGVTAAILLPLRLLTAILPGSPLRDARPDRLADLVLANITTPESVLATIGVVTFDSITLFVIATAYAKVMAHWYSQEGVGAGQLASIVVALLPKALAGWLIVHVVHVVAAVSSFGAMLLPMIVFSAVTAIAIGAEGSGPLVAWRRSMSLAGSSFLHTAFTVAFVGLASFVIRAMIEFAPSAIGFQLFNAPVWLVSGVADFVGSVVTISFVAASSCVLYVDLRARREGLDLQMAIPREFTEPPMSSRGALAP